MSRKNIFFLCLIGLCLAIAVKLGTIPADEFYPPVLFPASGLTAETPWFPATHLGNNASVPWRFDPFIARLAVLCPEPVDALFGCYLLFYVLGYATLCLLVAPSVGLRSALVAAFISAGLLAQLFSSDILVFGAIVWWPWVTLTLLQAQRTSPNRVFPFLVIVFFFALRATKSGNLFAPYLIGSAIIVATALTRTFGKAVSLSTLLAPIAALLPLLIIETFPLSQVIGDYPAGARVLPGDSAAGFVRALVGFDRDLPIIDRTSITAGYRGLSLVLMLLCGWGWVLTRRDRPETKAIGVPLAVATIGALLACWDTLGGDNGAISPLRSLGRIVPELGLAPLIPITVALVISLFVLALTIAQRITPLIVSTLLFLGIHWSSPHLTWSWRTAPGSPHRVDGGVARQASRLSAQATDPFADPLTKNLFSPSAGIVLRENFDQSALQVIAAADKFESAATVIERVEASHSPELLGFLSDRDRKTRWSPQRGVQSGDEWIRIYLKHPQPLIGIETDPGTFITDYPGGLQVTDCSSGQHTPLKTIDRWLGPIRESARGFFYYGEERVVQLTWSEPRSITCLEIKQTATRPNVDWSIAEIRILRAENK